MTDQSQAERTAEDMPLPGGDFRLFVTRLSFQGMLFLGLLENPVTGTRKVDLEQASMILADLRMLLDRTQGNLEPEEEEHLRKVVGDLGVMSERVSEGRGEA
jgi:Domain of unknown function (DUF1844)